MIKRVLLALLVVTAFLTGYGVVAEAWPVKGRNPFYGYFHNDYDAYGDDVWRPNTGPSACRGTGYAIHTGINTKSEFIAFVKCKLNSGNSQEKIGARFIIQTMRGEAKTNPPSAAQIADWEARINNPAVSVNWGTTRSYTVNSYYQGTGSGSNPVDDAFYNESGSSVQSIVFSVPGDDYVIRRQCANPIGNGDIGVLPPAPPQQDFNMEGRSTVSDSTVNPGQTITFRHYLRNEGATSTSPTHINWATRNTINGQRVDEGDAGTFSTGQEKVISSATENYAVPGSAAPGSQICRRIEWNPNTENGGSQVGPTVCATVQYNFNLTPTVNAVVMSGGSPITGNVAEPGDTIVFTYAVNNSGGTVSQNITCTYRQATHSGYSESAPGGVFTPSGANCPPARTFPANSNTTTATESVPAVTANTTICKSLTVSPATQSGGSAVDQACVLVAAKPYTRVWGGDISAGNGLATTPGVCTNNSDGAIVGWNRRAAGNYAGAGTQYAAFALARITDFASAMFDPGGAPAPNGLSFSVQGSNSPNGDYGGSFGSVPCIPDYYAERPGSGATPLGATVNITSLGSGTYVRDGSLTFDETSGGNPMIINPGESITIYVDGDVFITDSILYAGSWDVGTIPLFRLVVRGNIYIENSIGRLDGIYIAQAESGSGGQIHTCTTGFSPLALGGTLYTTCDQKLTVNGAFIANQVRLLRTIGSLGLSSNTESNTSDNVAEIFNFGPAVWIPQPGGDSGTPSTDYDAIISLPPVL